MVGPVQFVVVGISDKQTQRVKEVELQLQKSGFRVECDLRQEKIGYKIREHAIMRVPYLLVIGAKELENGMVAVRDAKGQDLGQMSVEALIARVSD